METATRRIVRETIWHEFAHYFGMDEEEVRERERWILIPNQNLFSKSAISRVSARYAPLCEAQIFPRMESAGNTRHPNGSNGKK